MSTNSIWDEYPAEKSTNTLWDQYPAEEQGQQLNIDIPLNLEKRGKPLDSISAYLAKEIEKHPKIKKSVEDLANSPLTEAINRHGGKVGGYTNPFVGGALQEVGDVGASVGNLALKPVNAMSGKNYNIPHPDLQQYQEPGLYNEAGFLAGQLGAGLVGLGGLGTGRGAIQAMQRLPRPSGWGGLATDVAKGAAGGYATGENTEGDRTLGTALGAIAQPISSITNRGITNRVLGDRAEQEARHGEMYRDIFDPAEENNVPFLGEHLMSMGNQAIESFGRLRRMRNYREPIDAFLTDPSLQTGQELQSALGRFTRKVEKNPDYTTDSLNPRLQAEYEAATELRRVLQNDIETSLRRGGLPEEAAMYPEATRSFAQNVAPYRTTAISDVLEGIKHPQKLAKRLREDEKFMIELGDRYPELGLNKALPWLAGGTPALTALITALGIPKIAHAEEKKKSSKREPFMKTKNHEIYGD